MLFRWVLLLPTHPRLSYFEMFLAEAVINESVLYYVTTNVLVKKRRVIQRPNYSESDDNFSRVINIH